MEQQTLITIIGIILVIIFVIKPIFTNMMFSILKKTLPPISATEREAIDAGTVSYEQGLFAGKPDWHHLLGREKAKFSKAEQEFIDGPLKEVCEKLNDFDTRSNQDLSPEVWDLLKKRGFFSFIVDKKYGGLDFSAHALSYIVSVLRTKSVATAISVTVPNSLGPAKLLLKFGTQDQQDKYLPKLATGDYVPCFALTGITSGSDAASMRDIGIIVKDKGKLKIKANFSKRYITLAPIATLIGLAIDVYDPDGLLGDDYEYVNAKTKQVGITVALLKRNEKGLEVGQRHGITVGFMNGSIRGRNVMIDMNQVIGGKDYLGKGWIMLMACLGVGRAVSVPSASSAGIIFSSYYTMLYAGMRKQFNLPIGKMEGVMEKLSNSLYYTYINDSARALSVAQVDSGENPAVSSALIKYAATEDLRACVNDCMDVLAGKSICDGPSNVIQGAYQGVPVSITVEGANILTRTLITFSQGAMRAHPYLLGEVETLYMQDQKLARKKFASLVMKHMGFTVCTVISNIFHNLTRGLLIGAPSGTTAPSKYYRMVNLQAKQFALLSDIVLLLLGGRIRAKQMMSGRCADVLKNLYYAMATLKRFEDDGDKDLLPLLDYSMRRLCHENVKSIHGIIDNLPSFFVRFILRLIVLPYATLRWGVGDNAPQDSETVKIVNTVYRNPKIMDNVFNLAMSSGVFADVRQDYETLQTAEPLYKKLKPFIKSQELLVSYEKNWVDEALSQGLITKAEAKQLHVAEDIYYKHMNVDEFTTDGKEYLGKQQTNLTAS